MHATGVVPFVELLPLWALTTIAPWLRRLQRFLAYRLAWNGGVVVVFMLLVQHATTTGLLHMLEDGLVLAVLCQVHLINNIGRQQRPDLIFFNSFLIAFVTSFFAPDVVWSLLFVLHAFVLVPSLQVHALGRRGHAVSPAALQRTLRASVPHTLAIGALTALLFVAWPRDFRREGWLGETFGLRQAFSAGLAERIRIDDERPTRLGEDIVAEFEPLERDGTNAPLPTHWRATAFSTFDGAAWLPQDAGALGSRFATDPAWNVQPDGRWQRAMRREPTRVVRVRQYDLASRRLLTSLDAVGLQPEQAAGVLLDPKSFGGFVVLRLEDAPAGPFPYRVTLGSPVVTPPTKRTLAHFTALPDRGVPPVVHTLAAQLRSEQPTADDPLTIATATSEWLQQHRRYQLPGGPGFARNLTEFLLGTQAGHCEYFATALALLLRARNVPCRLAGGYLTNEWNDERGVAVARSKNAHAWVEVLTADGQWHTFDPTPASDLQEALAPASGWWNEARTELERWWAMVTGFGQADRTRWLQALLDLPREHPFVPLSVLAALAGLLYVRQRRRRAAPAIVHLQKAIRATGMTLRAGETPRELLARAAAAAVAPALLARLRTAAVHHESLRYGAAPADEPR